MHDIDANEPREPERDHQAVPWSEISGANHVHRKLACLWPGAGLAAQQQRLVTDMLDEPAVRGAPTFSVVIPVFNEAEVLPEFHRRLSSVMDLLGTWEAVYVNDGSRDG